jgi:hypothetical protein
MRQCYIALKRYFARKTAGRPFCAPQLRTVNAVALGRIYPDEGNRETGHYSTMCRSLSRTAQFADGLSTLSMTRICIGAFVDSSWVRLFCV